MALLCFHAGVTSKTGSKSETKLQTRIEQLNFRSLSNLLFEVRARVAPTCCRNPAGNWGSSIMNCNFAGVSSYEQGNKMKEGMD